MFSRFIVACIFFSFFSAAKAQNEVLYMWSGAVTPVSARINAKLADTSSSVRLVVSEQRDFRSPLYSPYAAASASNNKMVSLYIGDLQPGTRYYYAIESNGAIDSSASDVGSFTTFQKGAFSYSFVVGSCALNSDHPVYNVMRELDPLFYINMGDLHYSDINSTSKNAYRSAYESQVLSKAAAASFFKEVPMAYVWDDHDFCGNDSEGNSPGRAAARAVYQEYVPHYPLAAGSGDVPIYQAFTVGRVRFILSDLRSERTSHDIMSDSQKQWLYSQMLDAQNNNQLIAWVSAVPFIGQTDDSWGGYANDRRDLGDFLRSNIINMFILSGDAHMLAIDNGDNSDFSTGYRRNTSRYPVLQAAALNQNGSNKGGTYTYGPFPNPSSEYGQFGLVTVTDNGGDDICIDLTGYRVDPSGEANVMLSYNFCRTVGSDLKFKLYPNPTQRSVTLAIYNAKTDHVGQVSLINMEGQVAQQHYIPVYAGENNIEIDFGSGLVEGVYIVQIIIDGQVYNAKLIVAK
jgi:alkaline phosphatase D